jgi:DNA (cytosine-5)-methyltransferase 1
MNYYNDNDSFSVKWLKALIAEGLIPKGDVDDRSITEIKPNELDGYTQCHFFAGIGGWPYALRLSGWPEDRPVWTGSCPCQPFSVAGQGKGIEDERHLWPAFRWLIAQKRPATIFGEQVASSDGREWLSGVRLDLETMGYEVGASDLCAAGVGAPHIRQRLFWLGITNSARPQQGSETAKGTRHRGSSKPAGFWSNSIPIPCADGKWRRVPGRVAEPDRQHGNDGRYEPSHVRRQQRQPADVQRGEHHCSQPGRVVNTEESRRISRRRDSSCCEGKSKRRASEIQIQQKRGKDIQGEKKHVRPNIRDSSESVYPIGGLEIEPLLFPLADGLPNRVGALRGAGNAIVPQVAAAFIKACFDD